MSQTIGIDLAQLDELLDLDASALLRRERLELLRLDQHDLALADLVALDDLLEGNLAAAALGHPLVVDALAGLGLELVEGDVVGHRGGVKTDRDVDQAEVDRTGPESLAALPRPQGRAGGR